MTGPVNPVVVPGARRPSGYSDGMSVRAGARLVFVAGQVAWDGEHRLVGAGDFAAQFRCALENVLAVVRAAGGGPHDLASMTIYVTDRRRYLSARKECGEAWRDLAGKHYPAIALVEVAGLLEEGALVEIQAVAAIEGPAKKRIADALRESLEATKAPAMPASEEDGGTGTGTEGDTET